MPNVITPSWAELYLLVSFNPATNEVEGELFEKRERPQAISKVLTDFTLGLFVGILPMHDPPTKNEQHIIDSISAATIDGRKVRAPLLEFAQTLLPNSDTQPKAIKGTGKMTRKWQPSPDEEIRPGRGNKWPRLNHAPFFFWAKILWIKSTDPSDGENYTLLLSRDDEVKCLRRATELLAAGYVVQIVPLHNPLQPQEQEAVDAWTDTTI